MRRLTLAVIVLVASVACATNPVSGKKEFSLHERGRGTGHRPAGGRRDSARDGRLRQPGTAALRVGHRHAAGAAVAPAQPAVDVHRRRQPGHQRLCACRAATSTSRAASCRISKTRRNWPACSVTRSATSPRATPRSSTRGRRPAASASPCSASSCRRPRPSRTCRRWASACSSSSTAATTSSSRTGWAWSTPRRTDGIRRRCRGSSPRWRASAPPASAASRTGCPRTPIPARASARPSRVVAKFASGTATTTNEEDFARAIDGVVVGDSLEQGIVRGNAFLHPMMRIALEFPEGWEVANTAEQVMAREPGTQALHAAAAGGTAARPRHRPGGHGRDAAGRLLDDRRLA